MTGVRPPHGFRSRIPVWLRRSGIAVAVLIALLAGCYAAIQTPTGQRWAGAAVGRVLSGADYGSVRILRLVIPSAGRLRFLGVSVADRQGVWARAPEVEAAWSPVALLRGAVSVRAVSAPRIDILRRPDSGPQAETGTDSLVPAFPAGLREVTVGALYLHKPVLGIDAALAVRYGGPVGGEPRASLTIERIDRPGDRIAVAAGLTQGGEQISLRARVREAPGGVLARYLGLALDVPVTLDLDGGGPVRRWQGTLRARSGDAMLVDARIGVGLHAVDDIALTAAGRVGATTLAALGTPAPLRSAATFEADAGWRGTGNEIRLSRLVLDHEAGRLTATGHVAGDLGRIDAELSAALRGGSWLAALAGPGFGFRSARVSGRVSGSVSSPDMRLSATLARPAAPGIAAESAKLAARIAAGRSRGLTAELDFAGIVPGSPAAASLLGDSAAMTVRAAADRGWRRWSGIDARLRTGALDLAVSGGSVDVRRAAARFELEVAIKELSRLETALGARLSGEGRARAQVAYADGTLRATVSGEGRRLAFTDPILNGLIGARLNFAFGMDGSPGATIFIRSLRIAAAAFGGAGGVELDTATDRIAGDLSFEADDIGPVSSALGFAVGGRASLSAKVGGKLSDPGVAVSLRVPAARIEDSVAGPLNIDIAASSLVSAPHGTVTAGFGLPGAAVDGTLRFDMAPSGRVALRDISFQRAGARLTGGLTVPLGGGPITGRLSGTIPDLAGISRFAPLPLGGAVRLTADLLDTDGRQEVKLNLAATKILAGGVSAAAVNCTANLRPNLSAAAVQADCRAENARAQGWRASGTTMSVRGTFSEATVRLETRGPSPFAHRIRAAADVVRSPDRLSVRVFELAGEAGGQPLGIGGPVQFERAGGLVMLAPSKILVGDAVATVAGRLGGDAVSGDFQLSGFKLAEFGFLHGRSDLDGALDITAALSGADTNPELTFAAKISRLSYRPNSGKTVRLADGAVSGRIAEGALSVTASLAGAPGQGLEAQGRIPVRFSLSPAALTVRDGAAVSGRADWKGNIGTLTELFPLVGHAVSGDASAILNVGGTVGRPIVKGSLALRDGRYENLRAGTVLTGVGVTAQAEGDKVRFRFAAAGHDPSAGVEGSGEVALHGDRGYSLAVSASLRNLLAVRRDDVSAVVSGDLRLTGPVDDLMLRGSIETQRVEFLIAQPLPPTVTEVDVEEIGGASTDRAAADRPPSTTAPGLRLDLTIRMPRRVFVRGRGLDTEWQGAVRVSGPASSPSLDGKLEQVRGQFEFAGKDFKLDSGRLTFSPGADIDPRIAVRAEHKTEALTATISVAGSLSRPVVEIASIPEMPRDEILSRILFGKGVGQLNKIEAAQLAVAVASVSGVSGGGGGLLDVVRRTLGVDVLRVGTDRYGNPTAVLGKSVSDQVHVGVEQGAAENSSKVRVEVEVLPGVKLKSGVGAEEGGSVGIELQWDY